MALNERGRVVQKCWDDLTGHYTGIELDAFVIMPNHVHAILIISDDVFCRGEVTSPLWDGGGDKRGVGSTSQRDDGGKPGEKTSPLHDGNMNKPGSPLREPRKHTLGQLFAYFKYQTTKIINHKNDTPGRRIWQRNYWEHVIRNGKSYDTIKQYILENPLHWAQDEENPMRTTLNALSVAPP